MKKISIYFLLLATISTFGQTMTKGYVKYKMSSDNEQMAMMGDVFMTSFYDNENIKMTTSTKETGLNGFPLQMKIVTPQATIELTATEVSKELPADAFIVPDGYEKVTMEEFQQKMGG